MARANKIDTKLEIISTATRLFLEEGYTNVTIAQISGEVGISKGNCAFHFPSKEHLLTELIKYLFDFQWALLNQEENVENTEMIAYLLEITAMAGSCYEDPVARDLYVSAYVSPMSLNLIRERDTAKVRGIFEKYCQDWSDTDFILAENIVSGIEYSIFTTEQTQRIPLGQKIERCLDTIMRIYYVPEDVRKEVLCKIAEQDYCSLGRRMLAEYKEYVENMNKKALEEATHKKKS